MAWGDILVVAFVSQLAVLPGEKVQFIIAGLSTRYDPKVVVAAAGSAFAGWTALEIAFGSALKTALPPVALDALTAGLFMLFAVLLARSAPSPEAAEAAETDGGMATLDAEPTVFGRELSTHGLGGFVPIFTMMAAGEFGDKTQLVTIGLAAQYGASSAIWAGEMLAIVPVSIANAYFFHRFSDRFDVRKAYLGAAALFGFFALDTLLAIATGFSVWETLVGTLSDALVAAI
ncbi:TMEM165/GDT1 family protein [Haloferax namakaokahaiae]|uniref:TMEM165/GDT1 family protein n=1 Tax=Haloferax namakaokahaiae TaxID=1748331 RepID=A0ABD5ZGE8_9EURY